MKRFHVSRTIDASPERIWAILTDAAGYPSWNTSVVRIEGRIAAGETIRVISTVNPGRVFPLTVSPFDPPRSMTWRNRMPLGLFEGWRTYTLSPAANGATQFEMEERYRGLLAPLITRSIPDLGPSFVAYGDGLKARAEIRVLIAPASPRPAVPLVGLRASGTIGRDMHETS